MLRRLGASKIARGPRPTTRRDPHGLTARQLEVLDLMAEHLTNAEIAQRLFLSERTIDHHVSAILSKLHDQNPGRRNSLRIGSTIRPMWAPRSAEIGTGHRWRRQ
jgi:DNA-binding NarL/FixJ family response regulator